MVPPDAECPKAHLAFEAAFLRELLEVWGCPNYTG